MKFLIKYTIYSPRDGAVPFSSETASDILTGYVPSSGKSYEEENVEIEVEASSELEAVNKHFDDEGVDPLTQEQLDHLIEEGMLEESTRCQILNGLIVDFEIYEI
jgi:hypothetical protein